MTDDLAATTDEPQPIPDALTAEGVEDARSRVHELLANTRRRILIRYLGQREEPVSLDAAAEAVAVREADASVDAVDPTSVEAVRIDLHHVHVPKLKRLGLVERRRTEDDVVLDPRADALARLADRF